MLLLEPLVTQFGLKTPVIMDLSVSSGHTCWKKGVGLHLQARDPEGLNVDQLCLERAA